MVAVGLALGLAVLGAAAGLGRWTFREDRSAAELPRAAVRRADLDVTLTAAGRVESAKQTIVACELENLEAGVRGQRLMAGGASVILSLIPEGTMVRKGDVLCRLDSSDYEELVRLQRMTVERCRADHQQAKLDLEVANLAVREFREGTVHETRKDMEGRLALAQSTLERARDRGVWARRMKEKGYVPASQVLSEEIEQARAAFALSQARTARLIFEKYTAPITLRSLESQVLACEAILNYQTRRLQRNEDRLAQFEQQVERCTIRAPHDGFVIYVGDPRRPEFRLEEGMSVRQQQGLFILPDLSQMQVVTLVHETVASRVRPGMFARVKVEGVPDDVLEGHVVSVAQLPTQNLFSDVRFFATTVRLDTIPRGLLPGMTAEVRISTTQRHDVLAVPTEALVVEEGREVCYVAGEDGVERREVKTGEVTRDLVEVCGGLNEGEQVVLEPNREEVPLLETWADPMPDAGRAELPKPAQ